MPILIAAIVISFVAGLTLRRNHARIVAIGIVIAANAVIVWAMADGKGDDPAWLLILGVAAAIAALAAQEVGAHMRSSRHGRIARP